MSRNNIILRILAVLTLVAALLSAMAGPSSAGSLTRPEKANGPVRTTQ